MARGIMYSIQRRHVENIEKGLKTLEIRKKRPSRECPFTAYIYETKGHGGRGKVIGEFVCDYIIEYESEFWKCNNVLDTCMEQIKKVIWIDDEDGEKHYGYITGNEVNNPDDNALCKTACLSYKEIREYIGYGNKTFYGLHISQLKIYDKPKEFSEFYTIDDGVKCEHKKSGFIAPWCGAVEGNFLCKDLSCSVKTKYLKRAPQSWCYVEVQQ